jgi:hypothetical protein
MHILVFHITLNIVFDVAQVSFVVFLSKYQNKAYTDTKTISHALNEVKAQLILDILNSELKLKF